MDMGQCYVLPVEVGAAGYERDDKPAEVDVDFARLLCQLRAPGTFDARSLGVAEVDEQGTILDAAVPCQFDGEADGEDRGTVVFLLRGHTPAADRRRFHVCFDVAGGQGTRQPAQPLVKAIDGVEDEGQECFQVVTSTATYYYQKQGAGLSSLLDPEGNDWIGYHPEGGSAGHYRGIPNLGECGHPGYTNSTSLLVSRGPVRARILSHTLDRGWAWAWDVFPNYARMTLLQSGGKYWFLYEGTPGGRFDERRDYCVRSPGERTPASEVWCGDLPDPEWVCFGSGRTRRVLYLVHHEDDDEPDQYWPMEGNMTVFGFGRTYKSVERFMERAPAHFTIGFAEDAALETVRTAIDSAFRDLAITVGRPIAGAGRGTT